MYIKVVRKPNKSKDYYFFIYNKHHHIISYVSILAGLTVYEYNKNGIYMGTVINIPDILNKLCKNKRCKIKILEDCLTENRVALYLRNNYM